MQEEYKLGRIMRFFVIRVNRCDVLAVVVYPYGQRRVIQPWAPVEATEQCPSRGVMGCALINALLGVQEWTERKREPRCFTAHANENSISEMESGCWNIWNLADICGNSHYYIFTARVVGLTISFKTLLAKMCS